MFAINGPSGPTQRNERRPRDDRPAKEQLAVLQKRRDRFFQLRVPRVDATVEIADEDRSQAHSPDGRGLGGGSLRSDKDENVSPAIFKGCKIYFNGRTGKISSYYLAKLVKQHGGNMASEYKTTRVTHIVACNLNGSKAEKAIQSCGKIKCVRPEWILESIRCGRRLPEYDFLVYKDSSAPTMHSFAKLAGPTPSKDSKALTSAHLTHGDENSAKEPQENHATTLKRSWR